MAIDHLQVIWLRKSFTFLLPFFLAACIASQPYPVGIVVAPSAAVQQVRSPKVGQQWVYQVRNVFNREIIDTVTETVISVGSEVRIARSGVKAGPLPDEIQSPWGYALQDSHWSPAQKFQQALPIWPEKLVAGWSGFYKTRYSVPNYPDSTYYWGLNIEALQWEQITVPAGTFVTMRYHNEAPYFESNDVFRVVNYRQEDVWLAPEIGRWVIRRGYGRYLTTGVVWANAYWEDYLEWELISWK